MKWLEISVETEAAAVETVSGILHEYGEGGVAVYQDVVPDDEDAAYHYDTTRPTTVTTYAPATPDGERRRDAIAIALGHLTAFNLAHIGPVRTRAVDEEDWANAWKRFYHPMRFGRRLVIKPSWRDYTPEPDDIVIELDPGMAFGTGLHQTTALCLALLEDYIAPAAAGEPSGPRGPGMHVLDQGTGSGILAIAAARLGASRVVAVDSSEVAAQATRDNAARNGLAGRVEALWGEAIPGSQAWRETTTRPGGSAPDDPTGTSGLAWQEDRPLPRMGAYDVVIANIIANVIIALAPGFAAALKPGGTLIASGIIRDREDDVRAALAAAGFTVARREARDEWVALVARH